MRSKVLFLLAGSAACLATASPAPRSESGSDLSHLGTAALAPAPVSETILGARGIGAALPSTDPGASQEPTLVGGISLVVPPQEAPSRRRRRWRNRYPGPIPTPADWVPPEGPVRIGLQAGHWRADEAPRELSGLRDNGTSWRSRAEWEVTLAIARRAGAMLDSMGYVVDILPAVVPPGYRAHLFVSIHADGSDDPHASGYRVAGPRRDATGRSTQVVDLLARTYGEATGITRLPTVTRRMRNYYAFNFRRYEHALHPMTIGVILETGFLTSARDRRVILDAPERAARGIVEAVTAYPVTRLPQPADPNRGSWGTPAKVP